MKTYPIAQLFHSPQGEGTHVGTRMFFIRTAGCNVGEYSIPNEGPLKVLREQNSHHSICTDFAGNQFLCDTDYRRASIYSVDELLAMASNVDWICITGGEPFLHDLAPLVGAAHDAGLSIQIETSGTLPVPARIAPMCWITCSPKRDYLPDNGRWIDEFKFLVSARTSAAELQRIQDIVATAGLGTPVFVQPINGITDLDPANVKAALALQAMHPSWRISVQLHKLLGVD